MLVLRLVLWLGHDNILDIVRRLRNGVVDRLLRILWILLRNLLLDYLLLRNWLLDYLLLRGFLLVLRVAFLLYRLCFLGEGCSSASKG